MALPTGPNQQYGFQVKGGTMRYASFRKTVLDARLAIKRGNTIVALHVPGLSERIRRTQEKKLKEAIEAPDTPNDE